MPVKTLKDYCHRIFKGEKRSAMAFSITLVIICIIGAGLGQVLLKAGISQLGNISDFSSFFQLQTLLKIITNSYIITAFIFYGLIVLLWLGAISNFNVSFLFPLSSLTYLVTAFAAWLILKETISPLHWIGICLIIGGCVLIAISKT